MQPIATNTLYFYHSNRISHIKKGEISNILLRAAEQPLCDQLHDGDKQQHSLLGIDRAGSIMKATALPSILTKAYTAFGFNPVEDTATTLGFNGEHRDTDSHYYLLGSGYRAYNPVLMRFNSADSWSPFGKGGINSYGYCGGDPVNHADPTGHMFGKINNFIGARQNQRSTPKLLSVSNINQAPQPTPPKSPTVPNWEEWRLNPYDPNGSKRYFGTGNPPSYEASLRMKAPSKIEDIESTTIAPMRGSIYSQAPRRGSAMSQVSRNSRFSIDYNSEATREAYLRMSQGNQDRRSNEAILADHDRPMTPRRETIHIRGS